MFAQKGEHRIRLVEFTSFIFTSYHTVARYCSEMFDFNIASLTLYNVISCIFDVVVSGNIFVLLGTKTGTLSQFACNWFYHEGRIRQRCV